MKTRCPRVEILELRSLLSAIASADDGLVAPAAEVEDGDSVHSGTIARRDDPATTTSSAAKGASTQGASSVQKHGTQPEDDGTDSSTPPSSGTSRSPISANSGEDETDDGTEGSGDDTPPSTGTTGSTSGEDGEDQTPPPVSTQTPTPTPTPTPTSTPIPVSTPTPGTTSTPTPTAVTTSTGPPVAPTVPVAQVATTAVDSDPDASQDQGASNTSDPDAAPPTSSIAGADQSQSSPGPSPTVTASTPAAVAKDIDEASARTVAAGGSSAASASLVTSRVGSDNAGAVTIAAPWSNGSSAAAIGVEDQGGISVAGLSAKGVPSGVSPVGTLAIRTSVTAELDPGSGVLSDLDRSVPGSLPDGPTSIEAANSGLAEREPAAGDQTLLARGADLLASCSPLARGAIEQAIDRFLSQLGASESVLFGLKPTTELIPAVMVTAVAIAVIETARRRFSPSRDGSNRSADPAVDEALALLPGRRQRWDLEEI